jgi:DNA polymerase III epsilon subunit-like protein
MIVLDIETSGLHPEKSGIWQIGALDLNNPSNFFLEECSIDNDEEVYGPTLKIIGKTEEQLRNPNLQSQKEMLEKFLSWVSKFKMRNFICQNPLFDIGFVAQKAKKYGLQTTFHYRSFDLHAISAFKYFQINNEFAKESGGSSAMRLSEILKFCGMKDTRLSINPHTGDTIKEGTPHNALEDAKLTAECFSRIVYGKTLLPEFKDFPIPDYMKSNTSDND